MHVGHMEIQPHGDHRHGPLQVVDKTRPQARHARRLRSVGHHLLQRRLEYLGEIDLHAVVERIFAAGSPDQWQPAYARSLPSANG